MRMDVIREKVSVNFYYDVLNFLKILLDFFPIHTKTNADCSETYTESWGTHITLCKYPYLKISAGIRL